jgi:UDP-2,3-diacylglucosamine hydrolase
MSLYIVSDLHIHGASDPIYRALLSLIGDRAQAGDTLVLAGDVFDLFVGNKAIFRERYAEFFNGLARAGARGVQIHYIEGNHDFLIRRAFQDFPGISVHSEEVVLEIEGKRFFLAHGDCVDSRDYGYRALRAFFRSPPFRLFVMGLPGRWVDWIGRQSSHYSRNAQPRLPQSFSTERIERLRNLYRSYAAVKLAQGYDFVALGHCHDLDEMSFSIGGRHGQYINVGFPPAHGSFLSWSSGEEKIGRERLPVI